MVDSKTTKSKFGEVLKILDRSKDLKAIGDFFKIVDEGRSKCNAKEPLLFGKRKIYYCFIIGILELGLASIFIFKFKAEADKMLTMPYVYLNMFILGIYPLSNALTKFASKKLKEKVGLHSGSGDGGQL